MWIVPDARVQKSASQCSLGMTSEPDEDRREQWMVRGRADVPDDSANRSDASLESVWCTAGTRLWRLDCGNRRMVG